MTNTAFSPNVRTTLNTGMAQEIADVLRQIVAGDILGMLIQAMTATEAGAAVASNQKTLAHAASTLLDVVATAGTTTGRKTILINKVMANNPAGLGSSPAIPTGFCAWDGGSLVAFAPVDAVTASDFRYARADGVNTVTSSLERTLGERD